MTQKFVERKRVLYLVKDDERVPLGARIRVLRKIRRAHHVPSVVLQFDSLTSRDTHLEIGLGTAQSSSAVIRALAEAGYRVPQGRTEQLAIGKYIVGELQDAPTITVPSSNGWFRDDSRRSSRWSFNLHTTSAPATAGTVASWRREVGSLLAGNSYLAFLASAAFSAPLIDLHADASPIIAVIGDSGTGKSTATNLARSIYFPASARGSFDATENGLSAFVREFSGTVVELDEIGSGDPTIVLNSIYRVANGTGKLRASTNGRAALQPPPYRGILLASGEHGLFEAASRAGRHFDDGLSARWIALPVDREHLMFEELHGAKRAADFAEWLTAATQRNYGAVGRAWIDYLVRRRNAGLDLGRKRYARLCEKMRGATDIAGRPRQFDRVSKHFALIATGGEMAIVAGLLPLKTGVCTAAAWYALRAWAAAKAEFEMEPHARLLRDVGRWLLQLQSSGRVAPLSRETFENDAQFDAFYYRRKGAGGVILVRPDALYVRFGSQLTYFVRALKDGGYLATGPRNEPRKQFGIPNDPAHRTPSFYAILPMLLQQQ